MRLNAILEMEMPESCWSCPFSICTGGINELGDMECVAANHENIDDYYDNDKNIRAPFCPLKEASTIEPVKRGDGTMYFEGAGELHIKTLEGNLHVSVNDYIIQGINSELYPCKPDIFEKTYEVVK